MIQKIQERKVFDALRENGARFSSGKITVTFLAAEGSCPQLAFAITKRFGNAVKRNRARRRLREAFKQAILAQDTQMQGSYLITASPAISKKSFQYLVKNFSNCLEDIANGAA